MSDLEQNLTYAQELGEAHDTIQRLRDRNEALEAKLAAVRKVEQSMRPGNPDRVALRIALENSND